MGFSSETVTMAAPDYEVHRTLTNASLLSWNPHGREGFILTLSPLHRWGS